MSPDGWGCAKGSQFEATLRARLTAGTMRAMGDNCEGPPNFKPFAATPEGMPKQ